MRDDANAPDEVASSNRITRNADGSVTIGLSEPIKVEGDLVSTITLHRPKAKTLMAMDAHQGSVAKSIALVAACARIAFANAMELDGEDFTVAGDVARSFLPNALKGGATS